MAWILACVFVRFLEDNRLIDTVWLAGPDDRLQLARDQHTLYFQANPTHSDREYLEHVFQRGRKASVDAGTAGRFTQPNLEAWTNW